MDNQTNSIFGGVTTTPMSPSFLKNTIGVPDNPVDTDYVDNTFANALKGIEVGKVISVKDASPIEHDVKVKLTSDFVTDFSSVKVYQQGKNIMPEIGWAEGTISGFTYNRNDDGTLTLNGYNTTSSAAVITLNNTATTDFSFLKPNVTYALSSGCEIPLCLETKKPNGSSGYYSYGTACFPETETPFRLFLNIPKTNTKVYENCIVKPQIEEGTVATEWVSPFVKIATANTDGTVEGFKSLPSMLFKTGYYDSKNVKINLEYNRDVNTLTEPLKFTKVYDGIIQNVTFDKPYTELYVEFKCLVGHGADAGGYLDDGNSTWAWFAGAEYTWYHFKLDCLCTWENAHRDEKINEIEFYPNAKGIVNFMMDVSGGVDNTTDTLTIYAR